MGSTSPWTHHTFGLCSSSRTESLFTTRSAAPTYLMFNGTSPLGTSRRPRRRMYRCKTAAKTGSCGPRFLILCRPFRLRRRCMVGHRSVTCLARTVLAPGFSPHLRYLRRHDRCLRARSSRERRPSRTPSYRMRRPGLDGHSCLVSTT